MGILYDKKVKARLQYRCDLCGGKIKIGEMYWNQLSVNKGVHKFKRHVRCNEICKRLNYYCEDWISSDDFKMLIGEEYKFIRGGQDDNVSFREKLNTVYYRLT